MVRFKPVLPEAVQKRALMEVRRSGVPGLSVFADVPRPGEEVIDVHKRLIKVAGMDGIDLERNKSYYHCIAGAILDAGFRFVKDGNDDEVNEHYSVDIGTTDLDSVHRFLEVFIGPEATWRS
ncbi:MULTISPECIES: hypothetical protein [Micromonospora]|uniref:Uncharacterized protein n=1 Tax=Micromonospora aurantiaca (nom. illeg.) TaxID=47850 RepID=A0ABQ6UEW2_9ACTN|nr:hypothetical protein [Micromonospora aurantiaca]KAB1110782.1 hypothetical protein F6X54_17570 [Micromonospora aurantiaca]UFN94859.1 hypothetical protein LF814_01410 [Micromonospora aurantiaca]